jgi:hypothetical protein
MILIVKNLGFYINPRKVIAKYIIRNIQKNYLNLCKNKVT